MLFVFQKIPNYLIVKALVTKVGFYLKGKPCNSGSYIQINVL